MYLAEDDGNQVLPPRILNISEDEGQIVFERVKKLYPKGLDAYKRQITDILQNIIDTEPVIQKIKSGQGLRLCVFIPVILNEHLKKKIKI